MGSSSPHAIQAAAAQFYHTVIGYDAVPDAREGRHDVFLLNSQDLTRASIGPVPNRPEAYPDWLGFVRVANLDDALAKATALGARVLLAPKINRARHPPRDPGRPGRRRHWPRGTEQPNRIGDTKTMKKRIHIFLLSAALAGSVLLLGACVGYVGGGPDYYGPVYGGAVFYGHPYYGGGFFGGPKVRPALAPTGGGFASQNPS